MTHDEIIKKLTKIKGIQGFTYDDIAKKTGVSPNTARVCFIGDNSSAAVFQKIIKHYGIDISLKKMRYEIFQSINNSDDDISKLEEALDIDKRIISNFLLGGNIKLYYLLDLMDHFNLEF